MQNKKKTITDKEHLLRDLLATNDLGTFFGISQKVLDEVWGNLTAPEGNSVIYVSMEIGADLDVFHPVKSRLQELEISSSADPLLDSFVRRHLTGPEKIPNYSGGLGVLAGDTLKSFSACRIPAAAVSLLYRKGYFSQMIDSRIGQVTWATHWEPEKTPGLYLLKNSQFPDRPLELEIPFFDENDRVIMAYARIWVKLEINEKLDFFIPEFLLDYSGPNSPEWIRRAADRLYDSTSERMKAIQRRMLGAGIHQLTKFLGIIAKTIHLNEQHGVVVTLQLIADHLFESFGPDFQKIVTDKDILAAADIISEKVVYTIHTPVAAGHDRFTKMIYAGISHHFCLRCLNLLAQDKTSPSSYNFTALAMKVNRATNSVSRMHRDVTRRQFPEYAEKITAITNGVHHLTWISSARAEVFDNFPELDDWRHDPGAFANTASLLTDNTFRNALENAWTKDTTRLTKYVNAMLHRHRLQVHETWIDPPNFLSFLDEQAQALEPAAFTIGFARRFSTYKRADLIFEDIGALAEIIVSLGKPVNFLFAGKAHPADEPGKSVIKLIIDSQKELFKKSQGLANLVFIPDYDMEIAKLMVAGVHAWLNNPKRPLEASGTSGMKAALNGVPNISIMDGWWVEGFHNGATGWKFGYEGPLQEIGLSEDPASLLYAEDSAAFYRLFPEILKTFYDPDLRPQYLDKSINNLALNAPIFNTHRVAAEYLEKYRITLPTEAQEKITRLRRLYQSEV